MATSSLGSFMVRGTLFRGSGHLYATGPRAAPACIPRPRPCGARVEVFAHWLGITGQLVHVMDRAEASFPSSCGQRKREAGVAGTHGWSGQME